MKLPIYMDYQATTPMDQRVLEAMLPYFTEHFGNAASRNHVFGWKAEEAVDKARLVLAEAIGADPREIVFTSGATESNNIALKGIAEMYASKGNHIITVQTEHPSILDTAARLERQGYNVTYLPVRPDGLLDLDILHRAITDKTILISVMTANNEIGVIQPIKEIGQIAREHGVLFHTDATQAVGKAPLDVNAMHLDLVSFTAHKIYGPKGIGALYVRRKNPRVRCAPLLDGGGHERGMRSGTLNVPGIVGFARAAQLALEERESESNRLTGLRNRLRDTIMHGLDQVYLNGHPDRRLPGNLNLSFAYVEGESLMMEMNDVALSSGSACTSASLKPSHVLQALGVTDELAHSSIRFGLGRFTTEEEVEYVGGKIVKAVGRLREMSPLYEMAKEGVDLKSVEWSEH
ncbi:MAG: IscS subfamily cysteine desulfurase [candidate division Zixibacteria bacterium]|nr:IscS subfamily cysteine desulfurase [candidate division Zixibacteria bacterium]